MAVVTFALKVVIVAIFFSSGILKLRSITQSARQFASLGVPVRVSQLLVLLVGVFEISLATLVVVGAYAAQALFALLGLMGIFTAIVAYHLLQNTEASCACFGAFASARITWRTLLRNMLIGGAILFVLVFDKDLNSVVDSSSGFTIHFRDVALGTALLLGILDLFLIVAILRSIGKLRLELGLSSGAEERTGQLVGREVPQVEIAIQDGLRALLTDEISGPLPCLILFTSVNCQYCANVASELLENWESIELSLRVLEILSAPEGTELSQWEVKQHSWRVAVDVDGALAASMGIAATPTGLLTGNSKRIVDAAVGPSAILTMIGIDTKGRKKEMASA